MSDADDKKPQSKDQWPFYSKPLMSSPEQVLFNRLVAALPDHFIFSQVQVSRVLFVKQGNKDQVWRNRINRLSYDFVICKKDSTVIAAVELDDSSHDTKSRKETDAKKDKATTDAGIRMIRWHVRAMPTVEQIRATFAPAASVVPASPVKDSVRKEPILSPVVQPAAVKTATEEKPSEIMLDSPKPELTK